MHLAFIMKRHEVVEAMLKNPTVKKYLNLEIPDIDGLTPKDLADPQIKILFEK